MKNIKIKLPPTKKNKKTPNINILEPDNKNVLPIQFKLPAEFRREFKIYATERNMTMTQLFLKMFEFYKTHH